MGTTQDAICFFFIVALMEVTVPLGLSGTANEHTLALPHLRAATHSCLTSA